MASAIHLWEADETKSQVDVNFQLFFVILKEIVLTYFFGICVLHTFTSLSLKVVDNDNDDNDNVENYDNENFHNEQCVEFKQGVP